MVSTKKSPFLCFKQSAWTSGSNYLLVGKHPSRPPKKPKLCLIDDWQHNSRRMAQKIEFQQTGQEPNPRVCQDWGSLKTSNSIHVLGIKCYSQWFEGERNQVSDALSPDEDRSNEELTNTIKSCCTSQVATHVKILQLPKEITSWLTVLLLKLPVSAQLSKVHTRSKIGRGADGKKTSNQLESRTISSLKKIQRTQTHHHRLVCHGYQGSKVFRTIAWTTGCRHSKGYHAVCMHNLSKKWVPEPIHWQQQAACIHSTARI